MGATPPSRPISAICNTSRVLVKTNILAFISSNRLRFTQVIVLTRNWHRVQGTGYRVQWTWYNGLTLTPPPKIDEFVFQDFQNVACKAHVRRVNFCDENKVFPIKYHFCSAKTAWRYYRMKMTCTRKLFILLLEIILPKKVLPNSK